ncbi:hypothetical protein [Streptomyces cellostaticus]|uniref:Cgl0159 family (beta/alpha)8-fold protein n=1 Tax=Streptomyces TaxID=1883 RepID=UPI002026993B|nr:hypothetical protein [Streptomyces cellostaticus]
MAGTHTEGGSGPRLPAVDASELVRVRTRHPEAVAEAAARRVRRPLPGASGRLVTVAAGGPARGAPGAGDRVLAAANRADLLRRLCPALSGPGVDGVLATADVLDDPLLLGVLGHKVVLRGDVGDFSEERVAACRKWRGALHLPTVRALVVGRSLLHPADGDVAAAVGTATGLL